MNTNELQAVILIPALEPDDRLPAYVDALISGGFRHVVIVDDGSSEKAQTIFDSLAERTGVNVLHHDVNHGKGVALKTGYHWIAEHLPDVNGVITADSDGQHTVEDCIRLARILEDGKDALYLGSRDFNLPDIPPKSRSGNRITSVVFKLFYGPDLPDTQTGLRAFRRSRLQFMQDVPGERYEYEMNVLISCARAGIEMIPETITTVYENNNAGTHFHPIRDSWRIYKVILGNFIKFMASSLAGWVIDQGVSHILFYQLLKLFAIPADLFSPISTSVARIVSGISNYTINRKLVFKSGKKVSTSAGRYFVLWAVIWLISTGVTWAGTQLGGPFWLIKIVVDVLLYLLSYRVQDAWVFSARDEQTEGKA